MGLGDKIQETADKIQAKLGSNNNSTKTSNDGSYEVHKPFTSNEVEDEYTKGHGIRADAYRLTDNLDKAGGNAVGKQTLTGTDKGLGTKIIQTKRGEPNIREDPRKEVPREAFSKGETTYGDTYGLNSKGQPTHAQHEHSTNMTSAGLGKSNDINTTTETSGTLNKPSKHTDNDFNNADFGNRTTRNSQATSVSGAPRHSDKMTDAGLGKSADSETGLQYIQLDEPDILGTPIGSNWKQNDKSYVPTSSGDKVLPTPPRYDNKYTTTTASEALGGTTTDFDSATLPRSGGDHEFPTAGVNSLESSRADLEARLARERLRLAGHNSDPTVTGTKHY